MKTIYQTEHICSECSTHFNAPTLSDFSYGEFLLWSSSRECRYLNAFEDETYREVIDLIESNNILHIPEYFLQEKYGELACDPDERGFIFRISSPPCTKCGSTKMASIKELKMGECLVRSVTHFYWNSLSPEEKKSRLRLMLQQLA